jgi:RNA polymerase sigma-70 factor (ECF subfamily)
MIRKLNDFTDDQLFSILKKDDAQAFDEIYSRYWHTLYGQAYKRLGNRETTEEVLQDLFTKIWINRHKIMVNVSVGAYLSASVKYLVLNQLQKEAVRKKFAFGYIKQAPTTGNVTEETILFQELQYLVAQEVGKLPPKCKSVFELSRYEQYSNKGIAKELNISEKTVENQIGKAIKVLKIKLKGSSIISIFFFFLG